MSRHIALLRGINVGGRNRVAMTDLRALVSSLGFDDVETYLQSGNVVFAGAGAGAPAAIADRIMERITTELGLTVPVTVRSKRQVGEIVAGSPFGHLEDDPKLCHVTFFDRMPESSAVDALDDMAGQFGDDWCRVVGAHAYLYCPGGYGETKLNNAFLERRLDAGATTRNWRTVLALAAMADG